MNSKERVIRAIEFRNPDHIPYEWFEYGEYEIDNIRSDILWANYKPLRAPIIEVADDQIRSTDEWNCTWVRYKSVPNMGQPLIHPLEDWKNYSDFKFPKFDMEKRFHNVENEVKKLRNLGKYIIGYLDSGIWERLHFLRGLTQSMMDLHLNPERTHSLLKILTDFKLELIKWFSKWKWIST